MSGNLRLMKFSRVIAFGPFLFFYGNVIVVDVHELLSLETVRFPEFNFPSRCVWAFCLVLWSLAISRSPCPPLVAVDVYRCVRTVP
ncbi:MAG: hypothetical protein FRX48_03325 [Lasallia pustulata]|uniref:Uncharacterized protein n=1 Tax=Lasallia pustulata TaxID=136370 RepID=A0A5M8PWY8_9LECA|nr:MAG: hypothetical protein FRX48_03325 [Lasallia pustulata]